MVVQDFDIDDFDSEEEAEEVRRDRRAQQDDLEHFAQMYILMSQNAYLQREVYLQDIHLQGMVDARLRIREATKLRQRELAQLKKARIRNEKSRHVQNCREMNSITGYFYEFWKWSDGNENVNARKEAEAFDVFETPDHSNSFREFWASIK